MIRNLKSSCIFQDFVLWSVGIRVNPVRFRRSLPLAAAATAKVSEQAGSLNTLVCFAFITNRVNTVNFNC